MNAGWSGRSAGRPTTPVHAGCDRAAAAGCPRSAAAARRAGRPGRRPAPRPAGRPAAPPGWRSGSAAASAARRRTPHPGRSRRAPRPRRCRSARCRGWRRGAPGGQRPDPPGGRERPTPATPPPPSRTPTWSWRCTRRPAAYIETVRPSPRVTTPRAPWATCSSLGWTSTSDERRSNRSAGRADAEDRDGCEHHHEEPHAPAPPAADHGPSLCSRPGGDAARLGGAARHRIPLPVVASQRPVGTITRGTTNPNRLRRVDRWLTGPHAPMVT